MNSTTTQTTNKNKDKIYLLAEPHSDYYDLLKADSEIAPHLTSNKSEATIVLADPPLIAKQLQEFPSLVWIQSTFAGVDALLDPQLRKDYQLTNPKGIFGQLISEYVLGHTLSYYRHLNTYNTQQKQQQWIQHTYQPVSGKTMLILGTGSIGAHLATAVKALGFIPIGVSLSGKDKPEFDSVYTNNTLDEALVRADVIVNTLPATEQTNNLLNATNLLHCKSAFFINVGRGNIVNADDLLKALDAGYLAHAVLDVFANEPISQQCPYWQHNQVSITPHIAAISSAEQIVGVFKHNFLRWQKSLPLDYLVSFDKGY